MIPERRDEHRWNDAQSTEMNVEVEKIPSGIRVLMYHRIVPTRSMAAKHWSYVAAEELRAHLMWLDRFGYTPITFEDYRLFMVGRLDLPRKPVVITFDDGYEDTHSIAAPLLSEFGMKAVIFVLGDRTIRTNSWDLNTDILQTRLMSDEQILELHADGHEIGSHSLSHPYLASLDRKQAWDEISRSRVLLEILLNAPVRSFCYPFGDATPALKRMVKEAGYTVACSVGSGPREFGKDYFEIRRIAVTHSTRPIILATQMTAPYQWLTWVHARVKRALRSKGGRSRGTPRGGEHSMPYVPAAGPEHKNKRSVG